MKTLLRNFQEIFQKFQEIIKIFKNFQEIQNFSKIIMQVFKIYRENIRIKIKKLRYFRKFQLNFQ